MNPDKYYGRQATGYDAQRMHRPDWPLEQKAVEDFVEDGPVLDCPCGTGRYVQIYKDKGLDVTGVDASADMIAEARKKHPDFKAHVGSILDLPFGDKSFKTAVCSRLLNWLYPEDMGRAIDELRRVADTLIFSIRTGDKGHHKHQANYTHSEDDLLLAVNGLHMAERRVIHQAIDGPFEFFKFRRPTRDDVRRQFAWHRDGENAIVRLSRDWAGFYGVPWRNPINGKISAEYWTPQRIGTLLDRMADTPRTDGAKNEMHTSLKPYREDAPLTVVRFGGGMEALLDGRRRANKWRNE